MTGLHPKHVEWLESRGISGDLAQQFGLETVAKDGARWLSIPYVEMGQVVNHKYRLTSEKRHQMDHGAPLTLWNHDALIDLPAHKSLVITEGEFDALIAIGFGWKACSVPNGAPPGPSADVANAKRYEFLWRAHTQGWIQKVEKFILATDDDIPGIALRSDLVSLLGHDRCSFVEYPFPCKDLNEVVLEYGPAEAMKCLNEAKPYPVKGLYSLSGFPSVPDIHGFGVGIGPLEDLVKIVPGTFTVLTGYSNMGKTTVMDTILASAIEREIVCCVASPETPVKPILEDSIGSALLGCSIREWKYDHHPRKEWALDRMESHLKIISNAFDEDLQLDVETFLSLARVAVLRHGARLFVLDPWNELEHKRNRDETSTEYVGRAIRMIKAFARQHGVAFWVVAHPTKPWQKQGNGPPSLYDVSDSANWANKADYGLVYHRPDKEINEATIQVVKVRKGLPGRYGTAKVYFDASSSRITGIEA